MLISLCANLLLIIIISQIQSLNSQAPSCGVITPIDPNEFCNSSTNGLNCYQQRDPQETIVSISINTLCDQNVCNATQIIPVVSQPGDSLRLIFEPLPYFRLPEGLSVNLLSSAKKYFECDKITDAITLVPASSEVYEVALNTSLLNPGLNYITFSRDIRCTYLRMVINLRMKDCSPPGSGTPLCSGIGVCAAKADPFDVREYHCYCPSPNGLEFLDPYCQDINECSSSPCLNGGTCHDRDCNFTCICPPGISGVRCEITPDPCLSSPCTSNGTCQSSGDQYICLCAPDFTGDTCQFKINNCTPDSCFNDGMCVDAINDFYCVCMEGFNGTRCEMEIDNCKDELACGSGDCVNQVNAFTCVCPPDLRMSHTCRCFPGYCLNGANCTDDLGYAICSCTNGYNGTTCEIDKDLCAETPLLCMNNGTCHEENNNTALCNCPPAYTGYRCQYPLDPCSSEPCANNGNCTTMGVNQFLCTCQRGYSGDMCQNRTDPCALSPCQNGGKCIANLTSNIIDEFQCICADGYTGSLCDTIISCNTFPCQNNSTCLQNSPDEIINCICQFGFGGFFCSQEIDIITPLFKGDQSYLLYEMGLTSIYEVRIRFRTEEPYGTILYSPPLGTQNADLLLIELVAGTISVVFDCGSGVGELTVYPGASVVIHDDTYHEIDITINKCEALVSLDGIVSNVTTASGRNTQLNLGNIYLGGVSEAEINRDSLRGCISNVEFNDLTLDLTNPLDGLNIGNCDMDVCIGITCQNGGRCIDSPSNNNGYACVCTDGLIRSSCGMPLCTVNHCQHGGVCLVIDGNAVCSCQPFFTGVMCEAGVQVEIPEFSGNQQSYIRYSIVSSSELSEISMRVKPSVNGVSGILAYANGREDGRGDYILLALSGGYPVLDWDLGSGRGLVYSQQKLTLNQYYSIKVTRSGVKAILTIDDSKPIEGSSAGTLKVLNLGTLFYLGGVSAMSQLSPFASALNVNKFMGCIAEFSVQSVTGVALLRNPDSGMGVGECQVDPCIPDPCLNGAICTSNLGVAICICRSGYTGPYCGSLEQLQDCTSVYCADGSTCYMTNTGAMCLCPLGRSGLMCGQDILIAYPSFSKSVYSHLLYRINYLETSTNLTIEFQSHSNYGLIFYTSQRSTTSNYNNIDFLSLSVFAGRVELRWNLGSGVGRLLWSDPIILSNWYRIDALRVLKRAWLTVTPVGSADNLTAITTNSIGSLSLLNTNGLVYVGGADEYSTIAKTSGIATGLNGCVRNMVLNSVSYTPSEAISGVDVESCVLHPCSNNNCSSVQTCVPSEDFLTYSCVCPMPVSAATCITIFSFEAVLFSNGVNYVQYLIEVGFVSLRFEFRTDRDGLIVFMGQINTNNQYLSIGVVNNSLVVMIGSDDVIFNNKMVTDEAWHSVDMSYYNQTMSVSLDGNTQLQGYGSIFNPIGHFWLGGHVALSATGYSSGLNGCVKNLVINNQCVDIDDCSKIITSYGVKRCS